jgi:hypothetical protein
MPSIMLSKCAKSLAIREAFINELGGLYTAEEMPTEFGVQHTPVINSLEPVLSEKGNLIGYAKSELNLNNKTVQKQKTRITATYYDISSLQPDAKAKAAAYLRDCEAKHIVNDVYRAPIKLEKLTQCITEDYSDADSNETQMAEN